MFRRARYGLLLAFVAACARTPRPVIERHPASLELVPVGAEIERAPIRSVQSCFPVEASEPLASGEWVVTAASHRFAPGRGPEPGRALVLASDGQASVRILGPFHQEDFNQVAIRFAARGVVDLGVVLERKNGAAKSLGRREIRSAGEPMTLVFDLPAARPRPGTQMSVPIVALAIRIYSITADIEIDSVELLFRPWEQWLPDPALPPEVVMFEAEGRRAVGLSSERPLECTLRPEVGSRLCFSYVFPSYFPRTKGSTEVVVQVFDAARMLLHERFPLTNPHDEEIAAWQSAAIDLAALAGRELRVRFSLRSEDATACALVPPYLSRTGVAAPTVLLITSDTHRADHLGCAPSTAGLQTPVLDALAARGVLFEDCFSQANSTRPSHTALMTATHPRDHGVITNVTRLSGAAQTLAELFRSAGYLTFASVSAAPVYPIDSGLEQGFDRYSRPAGPQRRGSEAIAEVMRWLPEAEGTPVFVWLHVFDAHAPYEPPADLAELYDPKEGSASSAPLPLPEKLALEWHPRVSDLRFIAASYKAEVTGLDRELAEILAHPRIASGVIAFTADHGESLYAHDLYFTHSGLYTDTLRIPLILVWPGAPAGRRVERPVQQMDVGRTLLDLAGLESVAFPGHDLLAEDFAPRPRFALGANRWCASITQEQWHLIVHLRGRSAQKSGLVLQPRRKHQTELYDLPADPRCEHDLVQERVAEARKLRALLVEWLAAAPAHTWCEENEVVDVEMLDDLEALGYAGESEGPASNVYWEVGCTCRDCQAFE